MFDHKPLLLTLLLTLFMTTTSACHLIHGASPTSGHGSKNKNSDSSESNNVNGPPSGSNRNQLPSKLLNTTDMGPVRIEAWRLANGLTVVLARDPNARSLSYWTWFTVGSRDENPQAAQTGLAHALEHLMFTQTHGSAEGAFDRTMEAFGGSVNAMTYYDFTAYVNNIPTTALATTAQLEADRMRNLALQSGQVETEREVILEERLQTVEDDVDGLVDELIHDRAFSSSPYRWPVIGSADHIKGFTRERILPFYRAHYAPNRATVVVAGNLDLANALQIIEAHYGQLPASEAPRQAKAFEQGPVSSSRHVVSRPLSADRLALAFGAPGLGAPDRAAFDVLVEILLGGPASLLQRALVIESEIASSASGSAEETEGPGLLTLWVQMRDGHAASEAEVAISKAIVDVGAGRIPEGALARATNRLVTAHWLDMTSSEGKAEKLGLFATLTGSYEGALNQAASYRKVKANDVAAVARRYLDEGNRIVVVAQPSDVAGEDADAR